MKTDNDTDIYIQMNLKEEEKEKGSIMMKAKWDRKIAFSQSNVDKKIIIKGIERFLKKFWISWFCQYRLFLYKFFDVCFIFCFSAFYNNNNFFQLEFLFYFITFYFIYEWYVTFIHKLLGRTRIKKFVWRLFLKNQFVSDKSKKVEENVTDNKFINECLESI